MIHDYFPGCYFNKVRPFLDTFLRWDVERNLPMEGGERGENGLGNIKEVVNS